MIENTNTLDESAAFLRRITLNDVAITCPAVLCELDSSGTGADCVLAACEVCENIFRPNIVFTSRASDDALVDCVWREQQDLVERYPHACLLMMSPYMRPTKTDGYLEPIGFATTSSYIVDDSAVIVKRWDFSTGEKHLCATASFLPSQMALVESTFTWIIDHLEFHVPQAALTLSARKASRTGAIIDTAVSQRLGYPVLNQLYFPRAALKKARYYRAEDILSHLKDLGADIQGPHLLDIVLTTKRKTGNYQIMRGNAGPIVLRTALSTLDDDIIYHADYPEYTAYSCPIELVLHDALAWLCVLPNYTFQDAITISEHELEERIEDTTPGQAWKRFQLYANGAVRNWIAIPDKDCFYDEGIASADGQVQLSAIPHFHIISTLAEIISEAITID